jgi:hypothetical protein
MDKELRIYNPDGETYRVVEPKQDDIIQDKKITFDSPRGLEAEEWFNEAIRRQEVRNETEDTYDYCKIELNSDRPVAIGITGDWHLGGSCNLDMLKKDVKIMAEHPLVAGGFFLGDLVDAANFNPAQDETTVSFEEQRQWMESILHTIGKDRVLGLFKGNHDHKWERKHGTSKYAELSKKFECPVFYGNSYIDLYVNEQNYRCLGSHSLRGSSIYNNAHSSVRGHREIQGLDVVFSGHNHRKGKLEQSVREFNGARKTYAITAGTYQYHSEYGRDKGFGMQKSEEQGMWWLILNHDKKLIRVQDTDQMLETMSNYLK